MSVHLTEEEQIEAFKRWWNENGKMTIAAVVVCASGYFGFGFFNDYQDKKASEASLEYDQLVDVVIKDNPSEKLTSDEKTKAQNLASSLIDNSDSLYSDLSAFFLAKLSVEEGELDKAAEYLKNIALKSDSESSIQLANLRLAKVYAAQNKNEEALALLNQKRDEAFESAYAETKGDILMSLGRLDEARTAYQSALDQIQKISDRNTVMQQSIIQFKMDNTRVAGNEDDATEQPLNPHGQVVPAQQTLEISASGETQ